MKKYNWTVLATVAAALMLSGCAGSKGAYSGDIRDDDVTEGTVSVSELVDDDVVAVEPEFLEPPVEIENDVREEPGTLTQERIVYFDYDKAVVRGEDMPILQAHAEFLSRNRGLLVVLGGHADERGSNEYNLALGQRRADAVRDILLELGVLPRQMESLSFGEERPRASGQNETAWQENRRVEIRYTDE